MGAHSPSSLRSFGRQIGSPIHRMTIAFKTERDGAISRLPRNANINVISVLNQSAQCELASIAICLFDDGFRLGPYVGRRNSVGCSPSSGCFCISCFMVIAECIFCLPFWLCG